MKLQHELEMEEAGLEPHPEVDEDMEVEDNQGKVYYQNCKGFFHSKSLSSQNFFQIISSAMCA